MTSDKASTQQIVDRLVDMAQAADMADRRTDQRYPFFQPVSLSIDGGGRNRFSFSAFSRDISADGMGLLHNMPLRPGEAVLKVYEDSGEVAIPCEIKWCEPCGEGWFLSGVRFLD